MYARDHGPVLLSGELRMTFRVQRYACLVRKPDAGNLHVRFDERCALQAHEIQQPEMAALAKPSQQPGTESCVVSGNGHREA